MADNSEQTGEGLGTSIGSFITGSTQTMRNIESKYSNNAAMNRGEAAIPGKMGNKDHSNTGTDAVTGGGSQKQPEEPSLIGGMVSKALNGSSPSKVLNGNGGMASSK